MNKNVKSRSKTSALTLAAFVLALVSVTITGAHASTLAWSGFRTIQSISTEGANTVFVVDGAKAVSQSSCNNKFRIDANDPDGASKVARINAAYGAGKQVNVSFASDSTACSVLVFEIQVQP